MKPINYLRVSQLLVVFGCVSISLGLIATIINIKYLFPCTLLSFGSWFLAFAFIILDMRWGE